MDLNGNVLPSVILACENSCFQQYPAKGVKDVSPEVPKGLTKCLNTSNAQQLDSQKLIPK